MRIVLVARTLTTEQAVYVLGLLAYDYLNAVLFESTRPHWWPEWMELTDTLQPDDLVITLGDVYGGHAHLGFGETTVASHTPTAASTHRAGTPWVLAPVPRVFPRGVCLPGAKEHTKVLFLGEGTGVEWALSAGRPPDLDLIMIGEHLPGPRPLKEWARHHRVYLVPDLHYNNIAYFGTADAVLVPPGDEVGCYALECMAGGTIVMAPWEWAEPVYVPVGSTLDSLSGAFQRIHAMDHDTKRQLQTLAKRYALGPRGPSLADFIRTCFRPSSRRAAD
jgi:hypothetical protein